MAKRYDVKITLISQLKACPNGHQVSDEFLVGRRRGGDWFGRWLTGGADDDLPLFRLSEINLKYNQGNLFQSSAFLLCSQRHGFPLISDVVGPRYRPAYFFPSLSGAVTPYNDKQPFRGEP